MIIIRLMFMILMSLVGTKPNETSLPLPLGLLSLDTVARWKSNYGYINLGLRLNVGPRVVDFLRVHSIDLIPE